VDLSVREPDIEAVIAQMYAQQAERVGESGQSVS
jgi:ABC-2 type transport system ATP-binding protein